MGENPPKEGSMNWRLPLLILMAILEALLRFLKPPYPPCPH